MEKDIWNKVKGYIKECGYTYTKEQVIDFYYNYYIRGLYCPYTFNEVMDNYEEHNKNSEVG